MIKGRNYKNILLYMLIIIMTLSLVACSQPSPKTNQPDKAGKDSEEITITDHLGRKVTLEEPAEKLVSGYYITTSMLIALGLEDNLVGVEAKAETRPIYKMAAPHFLDLPVMGTMKEFNLEGAAALEPDLVIISIRLKDTVESLEQLGINVLAVNPESMEELKETIEMIGKATAREEKARALISYYDEKTQEIANITKDGDKATVYLAGNNSLLSTATSKMYQNSIIEMAGGINVAGDIDDTYWADISYEQLIAYNPEIIIGAPGAEYTKDDLLNDKKLQGISAIKNGQVYFMPNSFELWDSPVPSGILGTLWITSILHEENYTFDAFKQEVYDFYKEFYNIEIDMEKITK